ncbi:MAG TPA: trypsin-like peptidase domain-containing protein [Holophagaceae bacterium]|nr:trypsin-like peptidase domain-containing protein [Holophagaceae bacterium]
MESRAAERSGLTGLFQKGVAAVVALAFAGPASAFAQAPPQPPAVMGARASVLRVVVRLSSSAFKLIEGSGVVIAQGLVATNAHVVMDDGAIQVDQNGQAWLARVRNLDAIRDIALLEVPGLPLAPAVLADAAPAEGERVFSWSYPGGKGPNLTSGALAGTWAYGGGRMLQAELDAARGSSGGGLFDGQGQLLGLTTFVLDSSPHSVFAVPAAWLRELAAASASPRQQGGSRAFLLQGFLERMSQDPDNQMRWQRFTAAWVRQAPQDPEAWSARAQALQGALEANRSAGVAPGDIQARLEGEVREALGKALALDATRAIDWHNLGASLDAENRFAEAEAAFREALRLRPGYASAWLGLGITRFNARDFKGAREALKQATTQAPDHAAAWCNLAFAERQLNLWPEAMAHFRIALGLSPFRASWWQAYGECAARSRDKVALALALERLQGLDPKAARELAALAKGRP